MKGGSDRAGRPGTHRAPHCHARAILRGGGGGSTGRLGASLAPGERKKGPGGRVRTAGSTNRLDKQTHTRASSTFTHAGMFPAVRAGPRGCPGAVKRKGGGYDVSARERPQGAQIHRGGGRGARGSTDVQPRPVALRPGSPGPRPPAGPLKHDRAAAWHTKWMQPCGRAARWGRRGGEGGQAAPEWAVRAPTVRHAAFLFCSGPIT